MNFIWIICGFMLLEFVGSSPIVKRDVQDKSSINEILVLENDPDESLVEEKHGEREKRKIGIIKLGVTNGIINFVFGKLDAFLDAKTKAIGVLDQSNKAKNAIYGIDNTSSATNAFLTDIIGKKIQAGTASIGPLINSATTFISASGQGLVGAITSKFAPLSALSGGLSQGSGGGSHGSGGGGSGGGSGGSAGGVLNIITSLSGSSGGLSGGSSGGNNNNNDDDDDDDDHPSPPGTLPPIGNPGGSYGNHGSFGGGVGY